jgi:hypothetical protein
VVVGGNGEEAARFSEPNAEEHAVVGLLVDEGVICLLGPECMPVHKLRAVVLVNDSVEKCRAIRRPLKGCRAVDEAVREQLARCNILDGDFEVL